MESLAYLNKLFCLEGRIGIVTGASRGIGRAVAEVLIRAGAVVVNFSRHPLDNVPAGLAQGFKNCSVDLEDDDAIVKGVNEVVNTYGKIDFLVNNAGISYKQKAEVFPYGEYKKIQRVDLDAAFTLSRKCFPYLSRSEHIGRIVSISSMGAYMGFSGVVPYCMMKSGLLGLTRALAQEWHDKNILVNSVSPGWVLTDLNQKMFQDDPERKQQALDKTILKKFIDPKEIGYMVLFLLGSASSCITGHDFPVDCGATVHGY